jgi:hypothetical protein
MKTNEELADIIEDWLMDLDAKTTNVVDAFEAGYRKAEAGIQVSKQGIAFGPHFWISHEKITGCSAEALNSGNCGVTARAYMNWLQTQLPKEQS